MAEVARLPVDIILPPPPPVEAADPWPVALFVAVLVVVMAALWAIRRRRRWTGRWRLGRLQRDFRRGQLDEREAAFRLAALLRGHLRLHRLEARRPPLTRGALDPEGWHRFVQALDGLRYAPAGDGAGDLDDLFRFAGEVVAKAP